jgi:hypothetical protein
VNLTRIIVLANSLKHTDRCLAGIEVATGKWVRPVTNLDDGRVRQSDMQLGGHIPQPLDILDLPLATTGTDFGFESENRTILPGQWHLYGRAKVKDVLKYARRASCILHNGWKYVTIEEMKCKAIEDRTTLELIHVDNFTIQDKRKSLGDAHEWKGIVFSNKRQLDLKITDLAFSEKLNNGHTPSKSCLLTMSLSMPYKPPDWKAEDPPAYWKLIAGVLEL